MSKPSRWGESSSSSSTAASKPLTNRNEPSNHDAIQALLQSATARQEERNQLSAAASSSSRGRDEHGSDKKNESAKRKQVLAGSSSSGRRALENNDNDYYGPQAAVNRNKQERGDREDESPKGDTEEKQVKKHKPNFALSGTLAKDSKGGNVYKGVLLKFQEPPEARCPNTFYRLYVYKGDEHIQTLHISRQSAYLFGRNEEIADIPLQHASCSSQHAVLQYRALPDQETGKLHCQPYLMDLESTNGSFLNGVQIDSARYYQLKKGDVLRFGASTREYVFLAA